MQRRCTVGREAPFLPSSRSSTTSIRRKIDVIVFFSRAYEMCSPTHPRSLLWARLLPHRLVSARVELLPRQAILTPAPHPYPPSTPSKDVDRIVIVRYFKIAGLKNVGPGFETKTGPVRLVELGRSCRSISERKQQRDQLGRYLTHARSCRSSPQRDTQLTVLSRARRQLEARQGPDVASGAGHRLKLLSARRQYLKVLTLRV